MKKSGAAQDQSASDISNRIAELWRLARENPRQNAHAHQGRRPGRRRGVEVGQANPPGTPVWSHDGIICTGRMVQEGREADLRQGRVSEGSGPPLQLEPRRKRPPARSTSRKEKTLMSPPSRRSFAKRSRSTDLASRNLRRKRSRKKVFARNPALLAGGDPRIAKADGDVPVPSLRRGHAGLETRRGAASTRSSSIVPTCEAVDGTGRFYGVEGLGLAFLSASHCFTKYVEGDLLPPHVARPVPTGGPSGGSTLPRSPPRPARRDAAGVVDPAGGLHSRLGRRIPH